MKSHESVFKRGSITPSDIPSGLGVPLSESRNFFSNDPVRKTPATISYRFIKFSPHVTMKLVLRDFCMWMRIFFDFLLSFDFAPLFWRLTHDLLALTVSSFHQYSSVCFSMLNLNPCRFRFPRDLTCAFAWILEFSPGPLALPVYILLQPREENIELSVKIFLFGEK